MENRIKIILVEDEVITAMHMETQLKDVGYEVMHHVTTGENAIIRVKQNPPDIILMDIGLAGELDGIEAASVIRSQFDTPIVFITGYDNQNIRGRAEKCKPLGYLVKPFEIAKLKIMMDAYFFNNNGFWSRP